MENSLKKITQGYFNFRKRYATGDHSVMQMLSDYGQQPEVMIVACCDSRVDPSLILQCHPGDIYTVRNVANIIPPYESDEKHHGTSAALEFGICYLNVRHLIILGHSQCGGINALLNSANLDQNDFITHWVSLLNAETTKMHPDEFAKHALSDSYGNCLTFPWIKQRVNEKTLKIHRWFFDIKEGAIQVFSASKNAYIPLQEIYPGD